MLLFILKFKHGSSCIITLLVLGFRMPMFAENTRQPYRISSYLDKRIFQQILCLWMLCYAIIFRIWFCILMCSQTIV